MTERARGDKGHTAVFGPAGALLISDAADGGVVAGACEAVLHGRPLPDVLRILTATGLEQAPDFAGVFYEADHTRLLVRGDFHATSMAEDSPGPSISGSGVHTWLEATLAAGTPVELSSGARAVYVPAPSEAVLPAPAEDAPEARATVDLAPAAAPATQSEAATPSEAAPRAEADPPTESSWHTSAAPAVPSPAEPPPAVTSQEDDPFRHMLGHTEYFGVEAAAVRQDHEGAHALPAEKVPTTPTTPVGLTPPPTTVSVPVQIPPPPSAPAGLIDSVPSAPRVSPAPSPTVAAASLDDGHTISRAEMLRLAGLSSSVPTTAVPPGPQVQAVHCANSHPNPPTADSCRTCGTAVVQRSVSWVARPILGRLTFDDGFVLAVHRPLLLGRQPTAEAWTGGEEPQLVPLPDPDQLLSRTHAELRIADWQLQVVDRGSRNGTFVTLPGLEPRQLREREPFLLQAGARVSLGGVSSFLFEESAP